MGIKVAVDLPKVGKNDIIVDNTILSSVATCGTQAAMRHVLGLTARTDAAELEAGSAVHEALARWLVTGGDAKVALQRFDARYKPWAAQHQGLGDRLAWSPVHRILKHWLETHDLKRWPWVVQPEHVEVPVWAELGAIRNGKLVTLDDHDVHAAGAIGGTPALVFFIALLDAIGKKRTGGGIWSIDHKTGRGLNQWYKERQEDASQFTGQLWAAGQRGLDLAGIFINGLELPELHTSERKCAKHGMSYKACALAHVGTLVFPVTRSSAEIEAWELTARRLTKTFLRLRATIASVDDVRAKADMRGRFVGACSRCTFRDWCRQGRTVHGAKEFIKQPWNPLDHAQRRGGVRDEAA